MSSPSSACPLLVRWEAVLRRGAGRPALLGTDGTVLQTCGQLQARADWWGERLAGLPAGQVVGVQLGNHPDWPAVWLALRQAGLVTMPLDRSLPAAAVGRMLDLTSAAAWIDGELHVLPHRKPVPWASTTLLKTTSGTTGTPRMVRFNTPQLLADADQIVETMGLTPEDVNYGVIPFSHSYGFSNLITPLLAHGIPLVVASDALPRAILEGITCTRASVLPGVPLIFQALGGLTDVSLPVSLRLCISAGAPLPAETIRTFHRRFGRKIHSFYGASECGGICYDGTDSPEVPDGFVGSPMGGTHIDWQAATERIQISGPAVGEGYFPDAEPGTLGGGHFMSGDLLARVEGARPAYRIIGRVSDFINVAGKKVNPREIETVLAGHPGVREVHVFGHGTSARGQQVIAAVAGAKTLNANDLRQYCLTHLASWQVPGIIWIPPSLPRTERGKIHRSALLDAFERQQCA